MKKLSNHSEGFTAIELLVFILVVLILTVVGITNVRNLRAQNRDAARKTDVNAVYYQLETFYEKNNYYPEKIDVSSLKGVDPESLKDSDNRAFNDPAGAYIYKPGNCSETKCKSYVLTADLEKEAPYVKESLNK